LAIPSAVDPHIVERAGPRASRWSARLDERPWRPGAGLLGFAWVDGGRDGDPIPEARALPPEACRIASSQRLAGAPADAGACAASRPSAAGRAALACAAVGDDDLIFVARTGAALKRGTFRARIWKPSLQRAGLPTGLRFHDLRHSYATWLVSDGVPINDVAKVMGNEQTSTTLDRYTHSTSERDSRVLRSFAAFSLPEPRDDDR
jgi:integrase